MATYDYDAMQRVYYKTAYSAGGVASRFHRYHYSGRSLQLEDVSGSGTTATKRYVWGKDLSGTLDGAGGVGGLLATEVGGVWYFPLYDNNGNITDYVSEDGEVVASYEYDAFGRTIVQSGAMADTFPFRFSTKYYDAEAKLYYYGERFYSPEMGRWLNRDPIEEAGGDNLYAFCGNNGVNKVDALGLMALVIHVQGFEPYVKTGFEPNPQESFENTFKAVDSAIAKIQQVPGDLFAKCWGEGKIKFDGKGAPELQLTQMRFSRRISREKRSRSILAHNVSEDELINKVKEFAGLATEDYDSLTITLHGDWNPDSDKPTGTSPFGDSVVNTAQFRQKIETTIKAVPQFKGKFKFVSCYQSWKEGMTQEDTMEAVGVDHAHDRLGIRSGCLCGDFVPVKMSLVVGRGTPYVY